MGRPKSANALKQKGVSLTEEDWNYLALWLPSGNPSEQLRELLGRARDFWPGGPNRSKADMIRKGEIEAKPKKPKATRPYRRRDVLVVDGVAYQKMKEKV